MNVTTKFQALQIEHKYVCFNILTFSWYSFKHYDKSVFIAADLCVCVCVCSFV